jgi:Rod binding domain-containing protein
MADSLATSALLPETGGGTLTSPLAGAGTAAARLKGAKTEKAARDFESVLLTSLFDSLQKSFTFDAEDGTPGAGDYRLMGTRAMAEAVSAAGGIGIARLVLGHLQVPKVSGRE